MPLCILILFILFAVRRCALPLLAMYPDLKQFEKLLDIYMYYSINELWLFKCKLHDLLWAFCPYSITVELQLRLELCFLILYPLWCIYIERYKLASKVGFIAMKGKWLTRSTYHCHKLPPSNFQDCWPILSLLQPLRNGTLPKTLVVPTLLWGKLLDYYHKLSKGERKDMKTMNDGVSHWRDTVANAILEIYK